MIYDKCGSNQDGMCPICSNVGSIGRACEECNIVGIKYEEWDAEGHVMMVAEQAIPASWIILDSGANLNLFCNQSLLYDIRRVPRGISIRTPGGERLTTRFMGKMRGYPGKVWYHEKATANVLSMMDVSKHYRVAFDIVRKDRTLLFIEAVKRQEHSYARTLACFMWIPEANDT